MDTHRKYVAPILAIFAPGAGHFAIGRWQRGLVVSAALSMIGLTIFCVMRLGSLPLALMSFALGLCLLVWSVIDVARSTRGDLPTTTTLVGAILALVIVGSLENVYLKSLAEAFRIPSGSMIPSLLIGDHFWVDKMATTPKRGEIIVFRYAADRSKEFVKRVIAVGGDTIEMREGVPVVNGQPLARKTIAPPCVYRDFDEETQQFSEHGCTAFDETNDGRTYRVVEEGTPRGPAANRPSETIPAGRYFVIGDNRNNSHDSRFFGPVLPEDVRGTACVIWWSSDHARIGQSLR